MANLRNKRVILAGVLGTLFGAYMMSPILKSPLQGDDLPNSLLRPALDFYGISLGEHIGTYIQQWWNAERRLFVVAIVEGSVIFYFLPDLVAYKTFQYCVGFSALLATASLICPIRRQPALWLLGVVCLLASLQFRFGYDPSIGFGVMLPSVWLKVLGAIFFIRACSADSSVLTGRLKALAAVMLWIAAILQYEVVVFFALIVGMEKSLGFGCFASGPRTVSSGEDVCKASLLRATRAANVIISISVGYLVIMTLVVDTGVRSPAYQTNFELPVVLETYAQQLSGVIPLAWWLFQIHPLHLNWSALIIAVALLLVAAFLQRHAMRDGISPSERTLTKKNLVLGVTLLLFAPLSTAVSVRWQNELTFGSSYINVYFQYLGFGVLLYEASSWCFRRWLLGRRPPNRNVYLGAAVTLLCFTASATAANRDFVSAYATPTRDDRQKVIDLLHRPEFRSAISEIQVDGEVAIISENYSEIFFVNSPFFNRHGQSDVKYNVFANEEDCGASCALGHVIVRYRQERSDYEVIEVKSRSVNER